MTTHNLEPLPRVIHLAGADGTGKTTQARAVMARLEHQSVRAHYVWLRYPRYLCTPFLVYARLRGYSRQEIVNETPHGYWEFERSWLMSKVFPWAVLVDAFIIGVIGVYIPLLRGRTVVCDRFVGDILVDLMVGTKDLRLDEKLPGRLFLRLLPRTTQMVVLELETAIAQERSPELTGDRSQPLRREAYLGLAARRGWPLVSSRLPMQEVTQRIMALITGQETHQMGDRQAAQIPASPDLPVAQTVEEPLSHRPQL